MITISTFDLSFHSRFSLDISAVDMWAAGVVMISLLHQKYPFFCKSKRNESIEELCSFFGTHTVSKGAKCFGEKVPPEISFFLDVTSDQIRDNIIR